MHVKKQSRTVRESLATGVEYTKKQKPCLVWISSCWVLAEDIVIYYICKILVSWDDYSQCMEKCCKPPTSTYIFLWSGHDRNRSPPRQSFAFPCVPMSPTPRLCLLQDPSCQINRSTRQGANLPLKRHIYRIKWDVYTLHITTTYTVGSSFFPCVDSTYFSTQVCNMVESVSSIQPKDTFWIFWCSHDKFVEISITEILNH